MPSFQRESGQRESGQRESGQRESGQRESGAVAHRELTRGPGSRPPRLLLIATGIDRRGAEQHVLALGCGFAARGWQVDVAYWGGQGELVPEFRAAGVAVHRLDFRGKVDPRSLPPFVELIHELRPDVVHTHLPLAEFYGNFAAALCRVPAIVSTKHSDHALFHRPLVRLGHIAMSIPNHAVVAVSAHMARFIESVGLAPGTPLVTIPNGVDVEAVDCAGGDTARVKRARADLCAPDDILIGAAGRLETEKGFDVLLEAMPHVLAALPTARLVIAGEGSRRPQLEALIHRLGLDSHVHLLGARADLLTLMHTFDLFVLSSRVEPFGLVLLEAMAAQRAIVATAAGGAREVVLSGQTGDLVPPGDAPALADSIAALLADPERAHGYGAAGRHRVEATFPIDRMLDSTEQLYRGLLAGSGHGPHPPRPPLPILGEGGERPGLSVPATLTNRAQTEAVDDWYRPLAQNWERGPGTEGRPCPAPTRTPIVFMGLIGLESHNREEQRLVEQFARLGHAVLYLAPLGVRDARLRDLWAGVRRLWRTAHISRPTPGLRAARLLVLPWRELGPAAWLNRRLVRWQLQRALRATGGRSPVYWLRVPTPELVEQLDTLAARAVVYDCIDDYSAYPQYRPSEISRLEKYERRLVAHADRVVTLSSTVAARFPEAGQRTSIVPLGVDLETFGRPPGPIPADLAALPRPRLGLVGGLDGRVDFDLLDRVASAEPTWSLVLIGPLAPGANPGPLADLPNVHFLGPRAYEQVPDYLGGLDVCLIPYRHTAWTAGIFPMKLHEYLASGRPVVATRLPALAAYDGIVELASDVEGFIAACRRAATEHDPDRAAQRRALAAAHSLETRCEILDDILGSLAA